MIGPFRRTAPDPAEAILEKIVAQARQSSFFSILGVEDTIDGRFEMILVHAFLYLHRLKGESAAARETGQHVFDLMFRDLDRNLHEMGVSYAVVPKRVKAMGRAFYGRAAVYDAAVQSGNVTELDHAVLRNVYGGRPEAAATAVKLAAYMRAAITELAATASDVLTTRGPDFPDPARFAA